MQANQTKTPVAEAITHALDFTRRNDADEGAVFNPSGQIAGLEAKMAIGEKYDERDADRPGRHQQSCAKVGEVAAVGAQDLSSGADLVAQGPRFRDAC